MKEDDSNALVQIRNKKYIEQKIITRRNANWQKSLTEYISLQQTQATAM